MVKCVCAEFFFSPDEETRHCSLRQTCAMIKTNNVITMRRHTPMSSLQTAEACFPAPYSSSSAVNTWESLPYAPEFLSCRYREQAHHAFSLVQRQTCG